MKFFCDKVAFIRKALIIIFLTIIILLLILGRFRTMRIKMVGTEEDGHTSCYRDSLCWLEEYPRTIEAVRLL